MTTIKTAFGYIRESTDDQLEYSPEAQRKKLHEYANKNGYILPDSNIFFDAAMSGKKAKNRPAFQQMIALAKGKDHPADAILVWKFSRFARNQEESIVYKSMLRRDGVEVVSVSEPLADGPFGSLIERIIEWMDEYYSIRLAEEVKKGMTEKARRGEIQANASFGYRVENNLLIPVPEEAAIVRELFSRFLGGVGCYPLAMELNARGVRTHRGNTFENRTVEYILRNPVYVGKLRWNPKRRTRRNYSDPDIITADAKHEPLVDMEMWEAVQQRLHEQKLQWGYKARPIGELKDWPSGLVRCAACGTTLTYTQPHYYKCNNYIRGRCSASQHIRSDLLKAAIIDRLNADLVTSGPLDIKIEHKAPEVAAPAPALTDGIAALERKKERLREAYLGGAESVEEYKAAKDKLDLAITELRDKLAQETSALAQAADLPVIRSALRQNMETALRALTAPDASVADKNAAARTVIETCTYSKVENLLSITYRVSI